MSWQTGILIAALAAAGGVMTLALLRLLSRRPSNLGAAGGRLAPCPDTPNCVCSQAADDDHHIDPLRYEGSIDDALARLRLVLAGLSRTRLVTDSGTYLHVECTSLLFRFVDDVEFLADPDARVIHVRSASRAGRSDLGVNRRRVEAIRRAFEQRQEPRPPSG